MHVQPLFYWRSCQGFGYQLLRMLLDFCIVTEAVDPLDIRFAAKPCHLSLGIIAMALLGRGDRLFKR